MKQLQFVTVYAVLLTLYIIYIEYKKYQKNRALPLIPIAIGVGAQVLAVGVNAIAKKK